MAPLQFVKWFCHEVLNFKEDLSTIVKFSTRTGLSGYEEFHLQNVSPIQHMLHKHDCLKNLALKKKGQKNQNNRSI
jgi:DNA-binding MurR/RpiR family transcriptional regulator